MTFDFQIDDDVSAVMRDRIDRVSKSITIQEVRDIVAELESAFEDPNADTPFQHHAVKHASQRLEH